MLVESINLICLTIVRRGRSEFKSRQGMVDDIYGVLLRIYMAEDQGVMGISPRAVELCTEIMVVHAQGIWSLRSNTWLNIVLVQI